MTEYERVTWYSLWAEIRRRISRSLKQPSIILYFLIIVLGAGGFGAWIQLVEYVFSDSMSFDIVTKSISTFIIAITASSTTDISLDTSSSRSLKIVSRGALLVVISISLYIFEYNSQSIVLVLGITLLTSMTWVVANSTNANLKDPPPDSTTGGDPRGDLSGDLSDINT